MTEFRQWITAVSIVAAIFAYFMPGIAAFRSWMCARRDELANDAKIAKRERR